MNENYLVIRGRKIECEFKDLDIFSIDYYYDNPRVNYIISKYPRSEVNSALITEALLRQDSTKDLIHDIETNGGLLEPVIVLDGKVLEGNTRLCAFLKLYNRTKEERWKLIKAQVIMEPLTNIEIFSILSKFHIKGKNPWDLYEKAACINNMLGQGMTVDEVSKEIRSTRKKVEDMLKAYKVMRDKYLKKVDVETNLPNGAQEQLKKFSYFEAFFINKNLADRATETPEFIDEFVEWVAEGRIPKAQEVRELHHILENKKARLKFLNADPENAYEEAKETVYWNRPDKTDSFYKRVDQFRELIREANYNKVREEVSSNPHMKNIIKLCSKDLKKFCKDIGLE